MGAVRRVTVSTGRVEIGQGVLTAMLQIPADELDVCPDRIDLQTGDTTLTPNEGYTAGSQSIQFGGIAMRLACAEVRSLFLAAAASRLGCAAADLSLADGAIVRHSEPTGQDYWSFADNVDLTRSATASAAIKSANDYRVVGQNAARVDLAHKVFGAPIFIHDVKLDGMVHARVARQPRPGGTVAKINEAAIRRAGKGSVEIIRHGNFIAILGADETVGDAAAAVAQPCRLGRGRSDQSGSVRGALAATATDGRSIARRAAAG
jgi:nicotinate dehydrogenase subunit B